MHRFQVNNDTIFMKNSCISQSKKKIVRRVSLFCNLFTNFFDVWIYRRQLVLLSTRHSSSWGIAWYTSRKHHFTLERMTVKKVNDTLTLLTKIISLQSLWNNLRDFQRFLDTTLRTTDRHTAQSSLIWFPDISQ